MSWASPIVEDPRWQERVGDDPVKIAEGRDRLWGEFLLHDPGAAELLEGLPEERVEGLRAEFDERLQESHPNAFTVKTAEREREVEVPVERMASAPGFGPAGTMYQGTRTRTVKEDVRRPVYDVATETFISRFGAQPESLDWEKLDQEDLEGATALLLEAYPDRSEQILGPARERAKSILKDRGMVLFPEADAEKPGEETELAKVFLQEASRRGLAVAEGAGAGPLTDLMGLAIDAGRGARVSAVPGVPIVPEDREAGGQREEIDKVMRRYTSLAKDNRRLADLAYGDDTALQRAAGTGLAWLGGANALFRGNLRGKLVAQRDEAGRKILTRGGDVATRRDLSFALDPLSKKGLAAGAGIDAAIGAAYGPEYAPSFIAQAVGLDPNRLTSAVESGAFGLAAGTLLRGLANQRMLSRVRKMPQFADLADLGDREFARAAVERMQEVWEAGRRRAAQQAEGSGTRAGPRETEAARRPAQDLPAGPEGPSTGSGRAGGGEAPAAPAGSAAPGDLPSVRAGDDFQITVQQPQGNVPGFVQVDSVRGGENIESGSVEVFREAGVDIPEIPDWVPQGRYSLQQLREVIQAGPEAAAASGEAASNVWERARSAEAVGGPEVPEPAGQQTMFDPGQVPVIEVPIAKVKLSEDVPQFKEAADEAGVVKGERLAGQYQRLGTAPIVVWERANGGMEVITGRHRLDLARRTGEETIPAQIVREEDGFTAQDALTFDAEANIRDGHGQIRDYAHYFRHAPIGVEEAEARGLLSRAKGEAGWHIGRSAEESLYTLYRNHQIPETKAVAIARGAPNHQGAQDYLIRQAKKKTAHELELLGRNLVRMQPGAMESGKQLDLFGAEDPWVQAAEAVAAEQAKWIKQNKERILAVRGALRRPEQAREMGIDVRDPEAVSSEMARLEELNQRIANPDAEMLAELRQRAGLPEESPAPAAEAAKGFELERASPEELAEEQASREAQAASKAQRREIEERAQRPLTGDSSDVGQGRLFEEDQDLFSGPAAGGKAQASAGDAPGVEGRPGQPQDPPATAQPDQVPLYVMEMPEIVQLAKALLDGKYPRVLEKLRLLHGTALGVFRGDPQGPGGIELRASIFNLVQPHEKEQLLQQAKEYAQKQVDDKKVPIEQRETVASERFQQLIDDLTKERIRTNPEQAVKTLAHEIGHLVDHLPDHLIAGRGNVLGRLATLKRHLAHTIDIEPLPIRLRRTAEDQAGPRPPEDSPPQEIQEWESQVQAIYDNLLDMAGQGKPLPNVGGEPSLILTKKVRQEIRREAEKQVGPRPPKDEEAELAAWREEVSRVYHEMIETEIGDRNLATVQEVRGELMSLSEWWKGDMGEPGSPYYKYRSSGVELYADAFSVLVNNPAELARRAPRFFEMWFNYLERKPEVKGIYEKLQDDIRSGKIYRDRVRNLREAFAKANERGLMAEELARTRTIGELGDWFRFFFDRTFGPVIRRVGKDPDLARRDSVTEAIEDFKYHQTQHELFLRHVKFQGLHPLEQAGLDWMDLSEYMFHLRVANERVNIANPLGWTPKQSLERLEEIERTLGPEKWAKLQEAQAGFRKAYEDNVLGPLRESEALSDELMQLLDENVFYSTFHASKELASTDLRTIEGALAERFGRGVTAGIYRQIGNLGEIEDPLTATIVKAMSLIRMAYRSRAARETANLLGGIDDPMFRPADFRWVERGGRGFREPVEVKTSRVGTLTYLHQGKVQAFYVPRQISEAFDGGEHLAGALFNSIFQVTHAVKGLFTAYNPGFWAWSLYWDSWGWINRMPGARAVAGPRAYLKYFPKAAKAAIDLARGRPNKLADEALRNHDVISRAYYRGEQMLADTKAERLLIQYGLEPPRYDKSSVQRVRTFMTKAFLRFTAPGQIQERIPKIAGRMFLEEHFSESSEWVREKRIAAMPAGEKKQVIHQMAGSPDYLSKGKLAVWLDTFGRLFYNPMKEGIRSKVKQVKERPLESVVKFLAYTAPPTIILWMLENGYLNEPLAELLGEDDADELELMMRSIPEREKTNHHIVPMGWHDREQMKVKYLRLPLDPNERALNASLRSALTQGEGGEGIVQYFGEALPGDNPFLQVGWAWWDYKMRGRNPYDAFYQRNVLTEDQLEAGEGTIPMLKWTSNKFLGSAVGRFDENDQLLEPDPEGLEKFLQLPGIGPTIGRWLRISNRGLFDEAAIASEPIRKHRAQIRLAGWEMVRKVLDEEPWNEKEVKLFEQEPYMSEWMGRKLPEVMTMREVDPELRVALQTAESIEERLAILQRFAEGAGQPEEAEPQAR